MHPMTRPLHLAPLLALLAIAGGSHAQQPSLPDAHAWLPTYSRFTGSGRVFFVARIDLDQESEYSAYTRKDDAR